MRKRHARDDDRQLISEMIDRIERDRALYDISYRIIPSFAMDEFSAPVVARRNGPANVVKTLFFECVVEAG